ncbi:hypothetical protein [Nocardiopsis deserti]|uniref:hypothetical protein n=1 Tax=Nocardiopsis deserti TaxID=2605988 RepID=UPI001CC23F5A|nr:hypothetical protein [Nocardiopsis deserti]
MRQFSAAALIRAFGMVKALFAPPCGRHSSTGGRRRRSTRVRRYVPVPAQVRAPVEATAPPAPPTRTNRAPERPERPKLPAAPVPAARLAPPSEHFPADDIALVRPYYTAREGTREPGSARVRSEATIRLAHPPGRNVPFSGDLLATGPAPVPAQALAPEPAPVPVPAPRPPSPACEDPEDWRTFTRLARVWLDQQQQRTQQTQRAQRTQQTQQPRPEHHRQAVPA